MKHFVLKSLLCRQVPPAKENRIPAPFPGKYPTRIGYVIFTDGKLILSYIGKPTTGRFNVWYNLISKTLVSMNTNTKCLYYEFDTENIIYHHSLKSNDYIERFHKVFYSYHPWDKFVFRLPTWGVKKIGGFRLYSEYKLIPASKIELYRNWMEQEFPGLLKPLPKRSIDLGA